MKNYRLASADFSNNFNISEIETLSPGIYNIYEDGAIKHHHNIVITTESLIYLSSFDRITDNELLEALEYNYSFGVEIKNVKRHPATYTDTLEFD